MAMKRSRNLRYWAGYESKAAVLSAMGKKMDENWQITSAVAFFGETKMSNQRNFLE
jgi:hypothetical protein